MLKKQIEPCGCQILEKIEQWHQFLDLEYHIDLSIKYCPKHAAALEMYEALSAWIYITEDMENDWSWRNEREDAIDIIARIDGDSDE